MSRPSERKAAKRRAKLKKRIQRENRPRKKRECGPCFACCTVFPVDGLPEYDCQKPAGETCKWVTDNEEARCGTYSNRPRVCGAYECLWIKDGRQSKRKLHAEFRPDELGIIFDLTDKKHVATKALGKPVVIAREVREGAYGEVPVLEAFDSLMEKGDVIVKVLPNQGGFEYVAAKKEDADKVAKVYSQLKHFKVIRDKQKIA